MFRFVEHRAITNATFFAFVTIRAKRIQALTIFADETLGATKGFDWC